MARKNTQQAVKAWIEGRSFRARGRNGSPIWTTGGVLYSYSQPIGKWSDADGRAAILNVTKYSVTTSCQQGGVRDLLRQAGVRTILCSSVELYNETNY